MGAHMHPRQSCFSAIPRLLLAACVLFVMGLISLAAQEAGTRKPVNPPPDEVASSLVNRPIFPHAVYALAFHPTDPRLAIGTGDGRLMIWNFKTGAIQSMKAHETWTFSIAFSADGQHLLTGGGDTLLKFWDVGNLEPLRVLEGHHDDVHGVALSRDGKSAFSAGDDRQLIRWNLGTGKPDWIFVAHDEQITSLDLNPDDTVIITASRDDTVRLFGAVDGKQRAVLQGHVNDVLQTACAPDGKQVLSASYDTTAAVWDIHSGAMVHRAKSHKDRVFAVAWSADSAMYSTGGEDSSIVISDARTHQVIRKLQLKSDVSRLCFSPDSKSLAVASSEGTVRILDTTNWRAIATFDAREHVDEQLRP